MKYNISNISHRAHDTDAEVAYFDFLVEIQEPKQHQFNYFYSFRFLMDNYIKVYDIGLYNYYNSTRKSLTKYGPYEVQTLEHIGEEALAAIYNHLYEYLMNCDWLPQHCEHVLSRMQEPIEKQIKEQIQIEEKFEQLESLAAVVRESGNRQTRFLNLLDKRINDTVLEIYPEITELEPERLAKLEHLFFYEVSACFRKIDILMHREGTLKDIDLR